jgi:hypothetical protein
MKAVTQHLLDAFAASLEAEPYGRETNELLSILKRRHYSEVKDDLNALLKDHRMAAQPQHKSIDESTTLQVRQTAAPVEAKKKATFQAQQQPAKSRMTFKPREVQKKSSEIPTNVSGLKRKETQTKSLKDVAVEIDPKALYQRSEKEIRAIFNKDADLVRKYMAAHDLGSLRPQIKKYGTAFNYLMDAIEEKYMNIEVNTDEEE